MTKSLQEIKNQIKRIVEDTNGNIDYKSELLNLLNSRNKSSIDDKTLQFYGDKVFGNTKPNGPFIFVFDCIDWFPNPIHSEEYTAKATNFADAAKEAMTYKKDQVDGILHTASKFVDVE